MIRRGLICALVCLAAIALAACDSGGAPPQEAEVVSEEVSPEEEAVGLANPASVYCEDQGYTLEIRADESGGEYGVCIFPDGSECEEWAFFRGECAPGIAEAAEEAEPPAAGEVWHPPSGELCTELQADVAAALGVGEVTLETSAPFVEFTTRTEGTGCLLTVSGTGADFETDYFEIFMQLKEMLESQGWVEDMLTAMDGPTGTGRGFRRDNAFLLLVVGWTPSDDADCPPDQPIMMCELTPEQRIFEITLNIAEQ